MLLFLVFLGAPNRAPFFLESNSTTRDRWLEVGRVNPGVLFEHPLTLPTAHRSASHGSPLDLF